MTTRKTSIATVILTALCGCLWAAPVRMETEGETPLLANDFVSVKFDLADRTFTIRDSRTGEPLLEQAVIEARMEDGAKLAVHRQEEVSDELGKGRRLILALSDFGLYRYATHFAKSGDASAAALLIHPLRGSSRAGAGLRFDDPELLQHASAGRDRAGRRPFVRRQEHRQSTNPQRQRRHGRDPRHRRTRPRFLQQPHAHRHGGRQAAHAPCGAGWATAPSPKSPP